MERSDAGSSGSHAVTPPIIYKNSSFGFKNQISAILLKDDDRFCRVKLRVGLGHQRKEIFAHPNILAASPFFNKLFTKDNHEVGIDLLELDFEAVNSLVNFLYTGTIPISERNVEELMVTSQKFELEEVTQKCVKIRAEQLSPTNCFSIRKFAFAHRFDGLVEEADVFIKNNFTAISECEDFLEVAKADLVRAITTSSPEVTKPGAVFKAVVRWVTFKDSARLSALPELMAHINLEELFDYSPEVLREEFKKGGSLQQSPEWAECKSKYYEMCETKLFKNLDTINKSCQKKNRRSKLNATNAQPGNGIETQRCARYSRRGDSTELIDADEITSDDDNDDNDVVGVYNTSAILMTNRKKGYIRTDTPSTSTRANQLIAQTTPQSASGSGKLPRKRITKKNFQGTPRPQKISVRNESRSDGETNHGNQSSNSTSSNAELSILPSQNRRGRPKRTPEPLPPIPSKRKKVVDPAPKKSNEKRSSSKRQPAMQSEIDTERELAEYFYTKVLLYPSFDREDKKKFLAGYYFQTKTTRPHHEVRPPRRFSTLVSYKDSVYDIGGSTDMDCTDARARPSKQVDVFTAGHTFVAKNSKLIESRKDFAACICQGYLYVIGGCQDSDCAINCAERIQVDKRSASVWQRLDFMDSCRGAPAAAVLGDKIYAIGGLGREGGDGPESPDGVYLSSVECFDPEKPILNNWDKMPSMNQRRAYHKSVVLNNMIYVVGGCEGNHDRPDRLNLNTVEVFDPDRPNWTFCAPMNEARSGGAVFEVNGLLYAVGGNSITTPNMEVYDHRIDKWSLMDWPAGLPKEVDLLSALLIDL